MFTLLFVYYKVISGETFASWKGTPNLPAHCVSGDLPEPPLTDSCPNFLSEEDLGFSNYLTMATYLSPYLDICSSLPLLDENKWLGDKIVVSASLWEGAMGYRVAVDTWVQFLMSP